MRLLGILHQLRRRPALLAAYRLLPERWRARVSAGVSSANAKPLRFRKTARWRQGERAAAATAGQSACMEAQRPFAASSGVNVYAYATGRFGLAESARRYTSALLRVGYPVAVHDVGARLALPHDMGDRSLGARLGRGGRHGTNLAFINPDYLEAVIHGEGMEFQREGYTIASWFWEVERFPAEWMRALPWVDEIMVASAHLERALKQVTDKPVLRVPLPVGDEPDSGLQRRDFGLSETAFVFLCTFDFNSYHERKNPLATIEAFGRAFGEDGLDVQLLLKSSNGFRHPAALHALRAAASVDDRIIVCDDIIDKSHIQALQRCADAFVSLHRAEGFGIALAECMRLGKPVVATGWSGNMEFMNESNSCPVGYTLVDVPRGSYAHYEGQRWAEPDIAHAARLMRRLAVDPGFRAAIGRRAASDIAAQLSPDAAADKIIRRLEELASDRLAAGAAGAEGGQATVSGG